MKMEVKRGGVNEGLHADQEGRETRKEILNEILSDKGEGGLFIVD